MSTEPWEAARSKAASSSCWMSEAVKELPNSISGVSASARAVESRAVISVMGLRYVARPTTARLPNWHAPTADYGSRWAFLKGQSGQPTHRRSGENQPRLVMPH